MYVERVETKRGAFCLSIFWIFVLVVFFYYVYMLLHLPNADTAYLRGVDLR